MATYVPNATQTTEPLESQTVESAALEFRTLKARVNTLDAAVVADGLTDLRVPETSIAVLPAVSSRAGKVLGFDAGGDPAMVDVAGATDPSLRSDLAAPSGASMVGYLPAGTGAVATTAQGQLRKIVSASNYGAVLDGVTNDSTAIANANAAAFAAKVPLLIDGIAHIPTATDITAKLVDTGQQMFSLTSNVTMKREPHLRPEWWGADPTHTVDSAAAFNACSAYAIANKGGTILIIGRYKLNSSWIISNAYGIHLEGLSSYMTGTGDKANSLSVLDFDGVGTSVDGLVVSMFVGFTARNLYISLCGNGGSSRAFYMYSGHDFTLENIKIDNISNYTSQGLVLGGGYLGSSGYPNTAAGRAVFLGKISRVKVFSQDGGAIVTNATNTTLAFENCYQVGGYFHIFGTVYSSFTSCACENAPMHGYVIGGDEFHNSTSLTFSSCGGEQNTRAVFYLSSYTQNIVFNAPYGAANNVAADLLTADLIHIDSSSGFVKNISIFNPTSVLSNAATTSNIFGGPGTGVVDVYGVDSTLLPKGFGGNGTWKTTKLTVHGDGEVMPWTPVLVGWTNTGTPTITGNYVKKGRVVTFYCTVVPGTNISVPGGASISGLPFIPLAGSASVVGNFLTDFGNALIGNSGEIYPQAIGVTTEPLKVTGTFII